MDSRLVAKFGQKPGCHSTFQSALAKYIEGLPEDKHKKAFIAMCYDPNNPVTPEIVLDSVKKIASQKSKFSTVSKVVEKVVNALKDYDEVVKSLASADPMPTAIIWGALSVVINGAQRHFELLDTIKSELRRLTKELDHIYECENLFGECPKLQQLFCDSYINMFRFWNRVYKELTKPGYKSVASAAFSTCLNKLKAIMAQIEENANDIEKQFKIVAEEKAKEERGKAEEERERAERARKQAEEQHKKHEDKEMRNIVCKWLRKQKVTPANNNRHEELQRQCMDGTCDWLSELPSYNAWFKRTAPSPVLLLYAPPGSGKSTLCSRVIQSVQVIHPVAYHFYRFDEPFKAYEVLRHFALQLFNRYMTSEYSSEVLNDLAQQVQGEMGPLQCAEEIMITLVNNLPEVYFFLDGLDEESVGERWKEASTVLNVLFRLTKQSPNSVRVWSSSQNVDCVNKAFKVYSALDIKGGMKSAMVIYLSSEMERLEVCEEDKKSILEKVDDCAAGNFLWAKLLINDLEKANSPADMKRIIKDGPTLDGYYKRYFERLEMNDRPLACYIFTLVAFARRPLRIKELQEAVGMLRSRDARLHHKGRPFLDPAEKPYISRMIKLFAPLIEVEVESDSDVKDNHVCHLYHSTILRFLHRNPQILCGGLTEGSKSYTPGLQISPMTIADACLLYLSQERYSHLLVSRQAENGREWFDTKNDPVANHHFLTYSAKYWDKHFDRFHHDSEKPLAIELEGSEGNVELRGNYMDPPESYNRVKEFLESPNFQTCIQVQSLFVDAQFETFYGDHGPHLKRVFPDWFGEANSTYKINYQHFLHEWKLLLNCANHEDETCPIREYAGEIDRCWWAALGPLNFLSKMKSRYTSFSFQPEKELDHRQQLETLTSTGDELKLLRMRTYHHGKLEFECEHWKLSDDGPKLWKNQTFSVQDNSVNWLQYVRLKGEVSNPSVTRHKDRAPPIDFSQDGESLRIGTRIYARNNKGEYDTLPMFCNKQCQLPYIEEFAMRGPFVALASRRRAIVKSKLLGLAARSEPLADEPDFPEVQKDVGKWRYKFHRDQTLSNDPPYSPHSRPSLPSTSEVTLSSSSTSDSGDDDSSTTTYDGESEISSESDNEAYESCSECSSGDSNYSQLEDDTEIKFQGGVDGEETDASDPEGHKDEDGSLSSDSEEFDVDPRVFRYGQRRNYGEDSSSGEEEWLNFSSVRTKRKIRRKASRLPEPLASISVFDVRSPNVPERIFKFSQKIPFMLYDSPPVVHPSKSLVIWPLACGNVLFADFVENTFFIRRLRPSTRHTRQIFMKCRFSVCGHFLHVAALEGQRKPTSKRKLHKKKADSKITLALLVSTYRLCSKQVSRRPPSLVHSTRVALGMVASLSMSPLPFKLTWRPNVLYLTSRHVTLQIYQVHLFRSDTATKEIMHSRPREVIVLPSTAAERDVHYFPPADGSAVARIIMGSDSSITRSSPIGCFVHEQKDLGGWIHLSPCQSMPQKRSLGHFIRPLEKFHLEDDCDLEPFIFLH